MELFFFHLSHDHCTEMIEVGYDLISKQCIRSLDDFAIASTTVSTDVLSNADVSLNIFCGLREIFKCGWLSTFHYVLLLLIAVSFAVIVYYAAFFR